MPEELSAAVDTEKSRLPRALRVGGRLDVTMKKTHEVTAKNDTIDPNSLMLNPTLCLLLEQGKPMSQPGSEGGCWSESRTNTGTPITRQASSLRG